MSQPRFALTAFADVNTCAPDWKRTVADDEYAYLSLVAGRPDDSANSADPSDLQGAGNARTAEAPLRDLLRAVIGMTYTQDPDSADDTAGNTAGDSEGFKVLPADALRVMAVFRLLGAGALLTVVLPERYWEIVEEHPDSVEDQVRAAETIRWAEISGGTLRRPDI